MVVNGIWTAEENYENYPIEKWCDCDYVANWIMQQNYKIETSIENLTNMIIDYYELENVYKGYYYYEEAKDSVMIHMKDLEVFVYDNGIDSFDYYA